MRNPSNKTSDNDDLKNYFKVKTIKKTNEGRHTPSKIINLKLYSDDDEQFQSARSLRTQQHVPMKA